MYTKTKNREILLVNPRSRYVRIPGAEGYILASSESRRATPKHNAPPTKIDSRIHPPLIISFSPAIMVNEVLEIATPTQTVR